MRTRAARPIPSKGDTLDLRGTDWIVLSCCDTGLGALKTREGVFGSRRVFRIAGAHTTIASLWPVRDEDTRRWMRARYEARFGRRQPTDESVRQACLAVIRAGRCAGLSAHPGVRAAFIARGDWR
ncbi:MAG: CHAT domain-containing protein [Candidatus Eisenbacteria bacterium]